MPRPGISRDDVASAVAALRTQGKPTTTRVVRLELGRGSYATIGRFLEELGAKSEANPPEMPVMPEDLQAELAESVFRMWRAMSKATAEKEAKAGLQHAQRVRALTAEIGRERETRKRLERELSSALTDRAAFKARKEALELEQAGLRERLAVEQALLRRSERQCEALVARLRPGGAAPPEPLSHRARKRTRARGAGRVGVQAD